MKWTTLFTSFLFSSLAFSLNSQSYFKNTLADYKADFSVRTKHIQTSNPNMIIDSSPIEYYTIAAKDFQPRIDYALIPSERKENLVVIQSGVHGIEGLTGAGIQSFLLEYLHGKRYANTSFLYIHMVNPWGTFNNRRTNPNNVDLNRNFVVQENDFKQKNDDYEKINLFLNPEEPFEDGLFKRISFYFNSVYLIANHSMETLRRSILKGQYTYSKGLYFGGKQYQPEFVALKKIWDNTVHGYKKIIYIDLHTGYGEKGKLHLLSGRSDSAISKKISELYAPSKIDFADSKNFYETTGDVLAYFQTNYKNIGDIYPVTYEFGTLNSQSTLGSLDSLYRMVTENQAYQHKSKDPDSNAYAQKLFRDMFYPLEFEWRDKVLTQTKTEIDKVINKLESL